MPLMVFYLCDRRFYISLSVDIQMARLEKRHLRQGVDENEEHEEEEYKEKHEKVHEESMSRDVPMKKWVPSKRLETLVAWIYKYMFEQRDEDRSKVVKC